ncbi:glucosaminidase domain-containing protein [Ensifer adhaerens]|uniref:Glucosaminidase domain-containing protein n=1 Tax=Ensifer adhaerens TaxID=106592 RepID=A0A9Q9DDQ9_ENSAD|nr:glucosaminidase domain-containing protein [Ensifer adhaerens]USJ27581.1 glucosaminidase domain-containing protein [Ensifer adhaerens]
MVQIDQSGLVGKIRDRPISKELEAVLKKAGSAAGIDTIFVTSGGQPGTTGRTTGSTRHNGGRAADLQLSVNGKIQTFTDDEAARTVEKFVTAAAAHGATGIGAGVDYMGPATLHVGFGLNPGDRSKITWGAKGKAANAPAWLVRAANEGWNTPPAWVFATDENFAEDLPEDQDVIHEDQEEAGEPIVVPERFSLEVIKAAQASQRRWGVPASVSLAQWALESAYGSRMPPGSNNPFGIKAVSGQPSVKALTTEVIGGNRVKVKAAFRVFESLEQAFDRHGKLLGTAKPYANARKFLGDPDRFADALTGVYATDPQYGQLLRSIMRKNSLYQFNDSSDDDVERFEGDTGVTIPQQQEGGTSMRVEALQRRLVALGYRLGEIDGKFGSLTAAALLAFQHDNRLPTTGILDATTEQALNAAGPRRLSDKRIRMTEKELVDEGSTIALNARRNRILSWVGTIFGAVGIGNSAIVNASNGATERAASSLPDGLPSLLTQVQTLSPTTASADFQRISALAKTISEQIGATNPLPADVMRLLDQLRQALPPELLSSNPDLARVLQSIGQGSTAVPVGKLTTVFDILPSFFANDSVLQMVMKGVAAVGGSVLPGFGGSLAVLGLGLAGRLLSNRIAQARVEDHRTGGNINPLNSSVD